MNIVQLEPRDHDEAVDFLNLIFGESGPHDFERMLPLCYRPEDMHHNWAIREEGRIRAIVGMFPRAWQVGEHALRVAGIGGVSTHRRVRGRGHMRALMERCLQQVVEEDFDLSWLAGRRLRYARYGYEVCGLSFRARLSAGELPDGPPDEPSLALEPLEPQRHDRLEACWALHEARPLRHLRPREDLYGYLTAWQGQPFVALDQDGSVAGYLVSSPDRKELIELVAREGMALRVLRAWLAQAGRAVLLRHPPLPAAQIREIGTVASAQGAHDTGNWRIFRWERVLAALLSVRPAMGPVLPGLCVLGIEGWGALRIACDGRAFVSEPRPLSEATLRCAPAVAMRLLFGPVRPSAVLDLPADAAVLDQWCPLPLYWAHQDSV
jgi:GNAT superfamily N-acetyltransferase